MTNRHTATDDQAQLDALLRRHQVPAPSADFEERVLAKAHQATAAGGRQRTYWQAFGSGAIAASLAALTLWLTLSPGSPGEAPSQIPGQMPAVAQIQMTEHQTRQLQLVFDSRTSTEATVSIELADNLQLSGFGNQRHIEWRTELVEGRNLLELPVELLDANDSMVRVALRDDSDRMQAMEIKIQSIPPTSA